MSREKPIPYCSNAENTIPCRIDYDTSSNGTVHLLDGVRSKPSKLYSDELEIGSQRIKRDFWYFETGDSAFVVECFGVNDYMNDCLKKKKSESHYSEATPLDRMTILPPIYMK